MEKTEALYESCQYDASAQRAAPGKAGKIRLGTQNRAFQPKFRVFGVMRNIDFCAQNFRNFGVMEPVLVASQRLRYKFVLRFDSTNRKP